MKSDMIVLVRVLGLLTEPLKAFKAIVEGLCKMLIAKTAVRLVAGVVYTTYQPANSGQIFKCLIPALHFIEL